MIGLGIYYFVNQPEKSVSNKNEVTVSATQPNLDSRNVEDVNTPVPSNSITLSNTNSFNSVNTNTNAVFNPTQLPTPNVSGIYQSISGSKVIIRNVGAKGLDVSITAHSRCDAEAGGRATWVKPYSIARFRRKIDFKYDPEYPELTPPEGESYCDTTLVFSDGKIKISESGNCSYFSGSNCGFDGGNYSKK